MYSFPRAPHANEETDFNIFTGEPKRDVGASGAYDRTRRNRLQPETRMAWVSSDVASPGRTPSVLQSPKRDRGGVLREPISTRSEPNRSPLAMRKERAGRSPLSKRRDNPSSQASEDSHDVTAVGKLLRERLQDITKERDVLRADLRVGYSDPEAQVKAEARIASLDSQIAEVEAALSRT